MKLILVCGPHEDPDSFCLRKQQVWETTVVVLWGEAQEGARSYMEQVTLFFMNCERPGTERLQDVILGGKSETTGRAGYGESPEQE